MLQPSHGAPVVVPASLLRRSDTNTVLALAVQKRNAEVVAHLHTLEAPCRASANPRRHHAADGVCSRRSRGTHATRLKFSANDMRGHLSSLALWPLQMRKRHDDKCKKLSNLVYFVQRAINMNKTKKT